MAPRPSWQGHLKLSLVACPVSLYPATTGANEIHFHLINPATGNRIRMQTVDPEAGEVERRDLVRGYEIEKGRHILLTDEELRSVRLESTRTIAIERFVDASEIDRIWWNDPYFMVPNGKAGLDAFTVIRTAMAEAGKVALARLVLSTRERVVAIEPRGKGMLVTTLRALHDMRDEEEILGDIPTAKRNTPMIQIAEKIIEQQQGPFDPAAFNDRYEEVLRELIASKQEGDDGGGIPAAPPREDNVIDLMEALRRSLEQGGGRKAAAARNTPAKAKPAAAKAKPTPKAAPAKAPTAKPAAKPATRRRAAGR
jgi:DNA end-binding protein Ku